MSGIIYPILSKTLRIPPGDRGAMVVIQSDSHSGPRAQRLHTVVLTLYGSPMPVSLQLAMQVRRLGRDGYTVSEIADWLKRPDAEIIDALTMLGLPMPGETIEQRPMSNAEDRAAMRDRMPKRMQDRIDRIARGEK